MAPLSIDTSTPATRPPMSDAVPSTVTRLPCAMVDPDVGWLTLTVGGVVSIDLSLVSKAGGDGGGDGIHIRQDVDGRLPDPRVSDIAVAVVVISRPHAHWMLPAENTSAPLGARY